MERAKTVASLTRLGWKRRRSALTRATTPSSSAVSAARARSSQGRRRRPRSSSLASPRRSSSVIWEKRIRRTARKLPCPLLGGGGHAEPGPSVRAVYPPAPTRGNAPSRAARLSANSARRPATKGAGSPPALPSAMSSIAAHASPRGPSPNIRALDLRLCA